MLSLARSLFQEQMSLERLVSTIIMEAKELLKCERCTVYLLELKMYDQVGVTFYRIAVQKKSYLQPISNHCISLRIETMFFKF